jgi:hypothetical protein
MYCINTSVILFLGGRVGYSTQEFNTAFEKVVVRHSSIRRSKAENVLTNMDRLWLKYKSSGKKFRDIIRLALNESNVWDETGREAYASLIGYLYNPRAQAAKRYRKAAPVRKLSPPRLSPPPAIVEGPKGQLAWEI